MVPTVAETANGMDSVPAFVDTSSLPEDRRPPLIPKTAALAQFDTIDPVESMKF